VDFKGKGPEILFSGPFFFSLILAVEPQLIGILMLFIL